MEQVTKTYGEGEAARLALEPSDLGVEHGELVAIVGPSGCGKSTLLMMIAGLLRPSGGVITLAGSRVDGPPDGLAVVFQDYSRSLFPWLTVHRNLVLGASAYDIPKAELERRIEDALAAVGLPGSGDMYPWQMSGGMQQRVAIARALVVEPRVMVMDEPFAAVDAQTRADLEDLVLEVRTRYDVTVLFVTHDIDEAVYLADRVVVMASGPGRVLRELAVDLPAPRDQVSTKQQPEFGALRAEVYRSVMRPPAEQVSEVAPGADASAEVAT
ncbi:ABC transporter ATP-binding protein [Nitriliruptoraceae bacterium ZYF776]|nr:ABC transporter ATP-binding protein [Profundirhabdus halotolerans]